MATSVHIQCSKTKHVRGFGNLLGYLPFLLTILIGGGIIVCYCIAISLDHVEAAFPYISDTGTFPPESCIFTLCLNSAAVVAIGIFTLKYLHIVQYNRSADIRVRRINKAALIVGYISAFGMMVVAAFQETNLLSVHVIGAMMAFVGGTVYMFLIASLGFMKDVDFGVDERRYAKARMFMAVISLISFIISMTNSYIASILWEPHDPGPQGSFVAPSVPQGVGPTAEYQVVDLHDSQDRAGKAVIWSRYDKGYNVHVIATAFEWVMALDLLTFLMTFSMELHIIQLQVVLVRHTGSTPSPTASANSHHTNISLIDTDNES